MNKIFFYALLSLVLFSCAKSKHKIGDMYKGGYIFKINIWGKGYCAAPKDKTFFRWGCYGTLVENGDGQNVGDGKQNTKDILSGCSDANCAAKVCDDFVSDGYEDWYLPSIGELELMYNKLYVNDLGDFKAETYWSSSQNYSLGAWALDFTSGERTNSLSKNTYLLVRPIRSF